MLSCEKGNYRSKRLMVPQANPQMPVSISDEAGCDEVFSLWSTQCHCCHWFHCQRPCCRASRVGGSASIGMLFNALLSIELSWESARGEFNFTSQTNYNLVATLLFTRVLITPSTSKILRFVQQTFLYRIYNEAILKSVNKPTESSFSTIQTFYSCEN